MNTRKSARDQLRSLVVIGLICGAVGGLVMGLAWPREEVTLLGDVEQHGSAGVMVAGMLVAWAGNALLFVGLVGYGVMLGREAAPELQPGHEPQ